MDGNGISREQWMGTVPVAYGTVAGVQWAVHGHLGLATHHDPNAGDPWRRVASQGKGCGGVSVLRVAETTRRLGEP